MQIPLLYCFNLNDITCCNARSGSVFSLVMLPADFFLIIMRWDCFNTQNYYINTFLKIVIFMSTFGSVSTLNTNDSLQDVWIVSALLCNRKLVFFRVFSTFIKDTWQYVEICCIYIQITTYWCQLKSCICIYSLNFKRCITDTANNPSLFFICAWLLLCWACGIWHIWHLFFSLLRACLIYTPCLWRARTQSHCVIAWHQSK